VRVSWSELFDDDDRMVVMLISRGRLRGTLSAAARQEGDDVDQISTAVAPRIHGRTIVVVERTE